MFKRKIPALDHIHKSESSSLPTMSRHGRGSMHRTGPHTLEGVLGLTVLKGDFKGSHSA